jgi:hypothetical protein
MDRLDSVTGPALPAQTMRIAVLVPCFNEEAAVATVIADFRKALPSAEIFVYDNNSSDRTVAVTILTLYRSEKPLRFFTAIGIFPGFDRPREREKRSGEHPADYMPLALAALATNLRAGGPSKDRKTRRAAPKRSAAWWS